MTLITRSAVACALVAALALVPAGISAQQSRGTTRPSGPAAIGIHGFSVVLVVGSLTGSAPAAATEGVPDAAKKALADMKDFLPYKRYQLIDAAWMMCCASPRSGVSGKVRGPDERDYRYEVDPLSVSETKLDVRFTIREVPQSAAKIESGQLSESARAERARATAAAVRELEDAKARLRRVPRTYRNGEYLPSAEYDAAKQRVARAEQRVTEVRRQAGVSGSVQGRNISGQNVIDSTFSIAVGETVVVGTSRLHGDRALIAILTAAGKPKMNP